MSTTTAKPVPSSPKPNESPYTEREARDSDHIGEGRGGWCYITESGPDRNAVYWNQFTGELSYVHSEKGRMIIAKNA